MWFDMLGKKMDVVIPNWNRNWHVPHVAASPFWWKIRVKGNWNWSDMCMVLLLIMKCSKGLSGTYFNLWARLIVQQFLDLIASFQVQAIGSRYLLTCDLEVSKLGRNNVHFWWEHTLWWLVMTRVSYWWMRTNFNTESLDNITTLHTYFRTNLHH